MRKRESDRSAFTARSNLGGPVARREKPGIVVIEQGGGSIWWLLVGGALGAGLALLFAPQTGEEARRLLGKRLGKLRASAQETLEEFGAEGESEDGVRRSKSEDEEEEEVAEEAEAETNGEGRGTASPARLELEKRLAEARARRRRALAEEDEEPVA
jgi:gas vesicle protein